MNNLHIPVLLHEAIESLQINANGTYVDCTAGRGGHSAAILARLKNGKLICVDTDPQAIEFLKTKFNDFEKITIVNDKFSNIDKILKKLEIKKVDGILLDLGVSSPMFDDLERGFSYHLDGPLDMRMNQKQKIDAKYIVNNYDLEQLNELFSKYGDIAKPYYVSKKIVETRHVAPITTTKQLVEIIKQCVPFKELNKTQHPARKYFQALRICVNDELGELNTLLEKVPHILNKNGTLVIITFHSLEDRIVKHVMRK
jgi:16S rRNA (cytosine1402-N4)-methyltransferase